MEIIRDFKKYLFNKNYKINTIQTYSEQVVNFLNFYRVYNNKDFDTFLRSDFKAYRDYLENETRYAVSSIKVIIHALRVFNEFLVETGRQRLYSVYSSDVINLYDCYVDIYVPTDNEVEYFGNELFDASLRMYVIFKLIKTTGMTISECLSLTLSDYDKEKSTLRILSNKNIERTIVLADVTQKYLDIYLLERPYNTNLEYIFISRQGNKVSRSSVNLRFKEISDTITPHTLRHYYSVSRLREGITTQQLQKELGTKSQGLYKQYQLFLETEKSLEEFESHDSGENIS